MTWDELLTLSNFDNIEVTIINPVRKGECYKKGRLTGFKSGLIGGGHSKYKNGVPHSFDSSKMRFIKPPKVHVTYNVFEFHKKEHSDWIDVSNCEFNFINNKDLNKTMKNTAELNINLKIDLGENLDKKISTLEIYTKIDGEEKHFFKKTPFSSTGDDFMDKINDALKVIIKDGRFGA